MLTKRITFELERDGKKMTVKVTIPDGGSPEAEWDGFFDVDHAIGVLENYFPNEVTTTLQNGQTAKLTLKSFIKAVIQAKVAQEAQMDQVAMLASQVKAQKMTKARGAGVKPPVGSPPEQIAAPDTSLPAAAPEPPEPAKGD